MLMPSSSREGLFGWRVKRKVAPKKFVAGEVSLSWYFFDSVEVRWLRSFVRLSEEIRKSSTCVTNLTELCLCKNREGVFRAWK